MKAKRVNEALGIKGARLDTYEVAPYEKAWVGDKGILGEGGILIPWEFIESMMEKYRK